MRTYTVKKVVKALQDEDNKKIIYYIPARGCGKGLTAIEEIYKYLKLGYKIVVLSKSQNNIKVKNEDIN